MSYAQKPTSIHATGTEAHGANVVRRMNGLVIDVARQATPTTLYSYDLDSNLLDTILSSGLTMAHSDAMAWGRGFWRDALDDGRRHRLGIFENDRCEMRNLLKWVGAQVYCERTEPDRIFGRGDGSGGVFSVWG